MVDNVVAYTFAKLAAVDPKLFTDNSYAGNPQNPQVPQNWNYVPGGAELTFPDANGAAVVFRNDVTKEIVVAFKPTTEEIAFQEHVSPTIYFAASPTIRPGIPPAAK